MPQSLSPALTIALCTFAALPAPVVADDLRWTAGPFDMPESAVFDPEQNHIVLSIIGGDPGAADGSGGLAVLSPDGQMLDADWVTGLDAPKGLALLGDHLLVSDLTHLHVIDRVTGTRIQSLKAPGAVFLNDVTTDGTQAFISDMMTDSIWRYADGALTMWMQDPALSHPNGLLLDGDRLVVGSWGAGLRDDFSTERAGDLLAVDLTTQALTVLAPELGNLDGIVRMGADLMVSDWITGALIKVGATGPETVAQYGPGLADIARLGDALILPLMLDGRVEVRSTP
ncbi:ATP/GTP-binding protein [Jannaschia pagri]|uniref:ATP/GTP-binding protein n=1 Tax=Jannaschia pagri TaxID=2829797 RepID=A0ABQ4NHQ6_9RHOB|nr:MULTISPECIES: hypothetical protein [unclassified Jannaschia]GIT89938.1 ATP/GTP-binding protein [Jannaschia sp. AI_61]GIT93955.1 ATP/GTP-binding protein [Jannaschia sp. AI_62]